MISADAKCAVQHTLGIIFVEGSDTLVPQYGLVRRSPYESFGGNAVIVYIMVESVHLLCDIVYSSEFG